MWLESHRFLLLSPRRNKVSGEQTQAVHGHPNVWQLIISERQGGTGCKHQGGETAVGLRKKTQTHQDLICLVAGDTLPPERACARRAQCGAAGRDELVGVPGAVRT